MWVAATSHGKSARSRGNKAVSAPLTIVQPNAVDSVDSPAPLSVLPGLANARPPPSPNNGVVS